MGVRSIGLLRMFARITPGARRERQKLLEIAQEWPESGSRAAQEHSKSSQRAPTRPEERPKNAQEWQKSIQEQPKRPNEDTFRELLMDFLRML